MHLLWQEVRCNCANLVGETMGVHWGYSRYVETSRGWILRPALQWRGPTRRLGGWACRNVRQIVSKSAQVLYGEKRVNLRAGIAQRVSTGLRPGKLRKKALGEDNKDSELARAIDQVILIAGGQN